MAPSLAESCDMKKNSRVPGPRPIGKKTGQKKATIAYAGFVDGKLDEWLSGFYDVQHLAIFKTKRDAKRCHEDVRRVRILVIEE